MNLILKSRNDSTGIRFYVITMTTSIGNRN